MFFALAYLFRIGHLVVLLGRPLGLFLPRYVPHISRVLFGYFGTMAILSLVVTVAIRHIKRDDHLPIMLHCLALLASLLAFVTRTHQYIMALQAALFLFVLVVVYAKDHKGFISQNRVLYYLLFLFWLLNLFVLTRYLLPPPLKIVFYFLSAVVFFMVYSRVQRSFHAKKG
ncbi:MAG: hypothetical protein QGF25_01570 [Candidatus Woesearchaeota archaeon]|nr:hypothetical protein [Candidatus Woesearchaeota archaeon]